MNKTDTAYKTIGEVAKILNLKSSKKDLLATHVIRFWETQFKQIKPRILNSNRRYYDEKTINLLKKIKFLLKEQGLTINGVKKILKNEKKLKLSKFGTFTVRKKKPRVGRNPKTKETKIISSRDVVLFKPSKEFKEFVNNNE